MDEKFFSPAEIAEKLKVNKKTVERWLIAGKLKGNKAGRQWRVKESELENFLQAQTS